MGEVYRAADVQLKRDVAVNVLPRAVTHDDQRLARFKREAELLAALNHPNVAQIYGLEQANGTTEPTFTLGRSRHLFSGPYAGCCTDVAPDDRRLFMMREVPGRPMEPVTSIQLVLNWFEELNSCPSRSARP
jgi:serine/threonine protein kinase